jgi:mannose-6-phosphate isomerase class I
MDYRKTSQFLLPTVKPLADGSSYDIYPIHDISGPVSRGVESLAGALAGKPLVLLDGFSGVLFERIREKLDAILISTFNLSPVWICSDNYLRKEDEIARTVEPFLGGEDPLFGRRTTLTLRDFFSDNLPGPDLSQESGRPVIIYGAGAALFSEEGFLVYFDCPKNEVQFRSRAGSVNNLGASRPEDSRRMYKRFYFVDWVVLNRHREKICRRIDVFADAQRADDITWITGPDLRGSLRNLSRTSLRARPWFEPGTWGGTWIKEKIKGLNKNVPNYAWSFELISPENGIILSASGLMLEISWDFLMLLEGENILGDCHTRFGFEFPIRFDFLDTFDGGSLSVQCHPRPEYMAEHFGENFTQEETYYILDTKEDAGVYLGFREDISKDKFRDALETSYSENREIDIEKYVLKHPAHRHDLFLIPPGTVHASGRNNLVLEISSTPYIFTFKMYDWVRPDLDGKPRPLNIARAMDNLYFDRKGERVYDELICVPVLENKGTDWELWHLPTHPDHLYDIRRWHFNSYIEGDTGRKCLVLSLVEGQSIAVETADGTSRIFSYAETFVIPAAAGPFRITNLSGSEAILVIAFVK